ncbi:hypothetical protein ACFFHK_02180 [Gallibacterium trehalosifermentans]|uniref:Uncharacterized protein n=1 Tax=Gallibacterium trehalosifermentans TaxID=516935 RepID=A0ABV6GZG5_9PAST
MTATARINFETSLDLKKAIKMFTVQHNMTIREFFEELAMEKLAQYNSDVQPLTAEEEEIMNEAYEFFSTKEMHHFSKEEFDEIVEKVKKGEDLRVLLKMDYIND